MTFPHYTQELMDITFKNKNIFVLLRLGANH